MASASEPPVLPPPRRPSVFISYASEDRAAARLLRDTLSDAGLEVWYDENELGGGDAWDQKIRRQIRECDYFMALISASTEQRKEGYFRREWRLASERTLDMADDVLFLLPVSIDGTSESGARVPDKFLAVQWLRAPGGQSTPALAALTRRLAVGDHSPPPRTPRTDPPFRPAASAAPSYAKPPAAAAAVPTAEIPPFPPTPQKGGIAAGLHFVIEVLKWTVTTGSLLFKRLPKWARVVIIVWIIFVLLPRCSNDDENSNNGRKTSHTVRKDPIDTALKNVDIALALKETAKQLDQTAGAKETGDLGSDMAKAGADIARAVSRQVNPPEKTSHQFTVIPFASGVSDKDNEKFASAVFKVFYRQLAEARGDIVGISLDPAESNEIALERGHKLGTAYLVVPLIKKENDETVLSLRLLDLKAGAVIWSSSCPTSDDPEAAGTRLASGVLAAWPKS
jgi:TolB-like protein